MLVELLLQDGGMVRKDYSKPPHHTMISDTRLDQQSVLDQPSVGNFAAFGAPRERSKIPHSMLGLVYWSTSCTDPDARRDEKAGEENTLRRCGRDAELPLLSPDSTVTGGYLSPVLSAVSPLSPMSPRYRHPPRLWSEPLLNEPLMEASPPGEFAQWSGRQNFSKVKS